MPKPPQNNTTFTHVSFARLIQPETAQMYRLGVEFFAGQKTLAAVFFSAS